MRSRAALGIYFEADRISLLSLRRGFGKICVKDCLSLPLAPQKDEAEFYRALEDFIRKTHSKNAAICVGLPRKEAVLTTLDLPAPTEENLREVLGYELDRHTPYSKEEACFGFQIIGRNEAQQTITILLAAVSKKRMDGCLKLLERLELTPASVEISSTALLSTLLYGNAPGSGRHIFVHLETDGAEISLMAHHALYYSRFVPLISDEHENALPAEIEGLITHKGWRKEEINAFVLAGETQDGNPKTLLKKIADPLGCNTDLLENLPSGPDGEALPPSFLIPLGLGLNGLSKNKAPLNLLPDLKASKPRSNGYQTVLPLLVLVLIVGGAVLLSPLIQGKKVLVHLNEALDQLKEKTGDLADLEKEVQALEARLNQLAFIREDRFKVLRITRALTETIPKNTWLSDLRYKENTVELAGYSASASALIPILERSPLFTEVAFSTAVTVTKRKRNANTGVISTSARFLMNSNLLPKHIQDAQIEERVEQFKLKAVVER